MKMHQVSYFLAVCEAENFTRAAQACNVAQPSLSKAIQDLEDEFGGPLFYRERNRTILTQLGRRVHPHIVATAEASAAAKLAASAHFSSSTACIRLGVMSTIAPTRMIGFLARLHEEIAALDLELREKPASELIDAMNSDTIDAALLALPNLPATLHAMPLYNERYVIAFPQGHIFANQNAVPIEYLAGEDYLTRIHCEFTDHFEAMGQRRALGVNVRYSSEREDWVQAMVAAGMGCTIMPEFLPAMNGIGTRPLSTPEVSRTVSLVTMAGRPHSAALAALIRLAKRYPWPGERSPA